MKAKIIYLITKMQNVGLKREGLDKFFTKKNIAKECCEIVRQKNIIKNGEIVIEPSAGNGAFIESIKSLTNKYYFYDLDPECDEIKRIDFLDFNIRDLNISKIHIIGNPPFGRQSSLAKKFIKKCIKFADTISFILPKSFKKDSLKKTFSLNFHLIHEWDIPDNSFIVDEKDHNVPCVFQIWKKEIFNREIIQQEFPKGYKFVKKEEAPDISFRRVGVNAGHISLEYENKSIESHYFIKFLDDKLIRKIDLFKCIKFDHNNTVGPKSISKPEIIKEFNKIVN